MTKEEKLVVINNLAEQLQAYPHFYIADIESLNAEQTASLLQLEQLKDELAARAQVMQARTRRSTHLLGKGRMLRAYPKLKHGQNNRSLNSLLEQLEKEYPDYFDHNNTFGIQ